MVQQTFAATQTVLFSQWSNPGSFLHVQVQVHVPEQLQHDDVDLVLKRLRSRESIVLSLRQSDKYMWPSLSTGHLVRSWSRSVKMR